MYIHVHVKKCTVCTMYMYIQCTFTCKYIKCNVLWGRDSVPTVVNNQKVEVRRAVWNIIFREVGGPIIAILNSYNMHNTGI